jgi:hypothetical protein
MDRRTDRQKDRQTDKKVRLGLYYIINLRTKISGWHLLVSTDGLLFCLRNVSPVGLLLPGANDIKLFTAVSYDFS